MRGIALFAMLGLSACAAAGGMSAGPPAELRGWQTATGTPPSRAEFAAVMAACQDRTKTGPVESCLADLGLRRVN